MYRNRNKDSVRNISFAITTEQFKTRTKTVTRRLGWKSAKPGNHLMGCKKCRGLKPGEAIERLGEIRIVSVRQEPLFMITDEDCAKEGFPGMNRISFVDMFCAHMHCNANTIVTRIEYEYV